jgi:HK97 family phage major capsid protein
MEGLEQKLNELTDKLIGKSKEQSEALINEFKSENETAIKEAVESGVKSVKDSIDAMEAKVKSVQEHADKLDIKLQKTSNPIDGKTLSLEIKENKSQIKELLHRKSFGEVQLKATTNRASVTGNQQAVELSDIGQLATRKLSMYDAFPKINIGQSNHNGVIRYYDWDEATKVRAAAMIAEGAAFPESTAKWQTYTERFKKVGDTLPVTEEFLEDEQMFAGELQMFLSTNVELEVDNQICNGDGTGENLTGLIASTPTFVPLASGITDASVYDLVLKVKESITATGGAKYTPDIAFMNISDILKYKLKKDANNNYVMPPFVDRNGQVIDGVTVIESNIVTANTMFVGDRRFGRIYQMPGITLSQGTVNNQFNEDLTTLKVRRRMLFLIRNVDRTGWKQVTDIDAALTTLAT